jgi:pimeloyl-ACP methyl ester carboxylesterase
MVAERSRQIEGRRQRWLEAGDPSFPGVIVWLHAFPVTAELWHPQLSELSSDWRVIAPDLTGFGGSGDGTSSPGIDDFAHQAEALLNALGVGQVVLGGLSMGGYAAFAHLRVAPNRVRALILADTRAAADSPQARADREQLLKTVAERGPEGVAEAMLPRLLGETTRRSRPGIVSRVREMILSNSAGGLSRAVLRLRDRPDATPQLRRITVPTLVLVGEEDEVTPPDEARRLAASIPGASLAVIPDAGHLSNLENPESFNAALAPWLAGL